MTRRISHWLRSVAPVRCTALNSAARSAAARCWCRAIRACSARSACWRPTCNTTTPARRFSAAPTTTLLRRHRLARARAGSGWGTRARGHSPRAPPLLRLADLRYAKQGFELTLEAPGTLDAAAAARLVEAFHAQHERLYTFAERETQVEIVTLRLRAIGLVDKIALAEIAAAAGSKPEAFERRAVRLDGALHASVPAYRRDALRAGHRIAGPAVVDQLELDEPYPSWSDRRGRPPRQPDHPAGLTHAQSRHRHAGTDQGRHPVGARRNGGADRAKRHEPVHPREEGLLHRLLRSRWAAGRLDRAADGRRQPHRLHFRTLSPRRYATRRPLFIQ